MIDEAFDLNLDQNLRPRAQNKDWKMARLLILLAMTLVTLLSFLLYSGIVVYITGDNKEYNTRRSLLSMKRLILDTNVNPDDIPYKGKRVHQVSSNQIPKLAQKHISSVVLNESTPSLNWLVNEIATSVDNFTTRLGIRASKDSPNNLEISNLKGGEGGLDFFAYGGNNWPLDFKNNELYSLAHRKRIEETMSYEFMSYSDTFLQALFDIIVVTGNVSVDLSYLNDWKPMIEHLHCIIIQQGDPTRRVEIPSWVKYELYTKVEIEREVGQENLWIFDMDSNALTAANFAFLVSDRDFFYFLHPEMMPIFHNDSDPMRLLRIHAMNLLKPSLPVYFHEHRDPFVAGRDFIRGVPYSLREGVMTGISYGSVGNDEDESYDMITRLMKASLEHPLNNAAKKERPNRRRERRRLRKEKETKPHSNNNKQNSKKIQTPATAANNDKKEVSEDLLSISTVAKGAMFTLSFKNIAVNRAVVGGVFCQLNGLEQKTSYEIGRYYDVMLGWILKAVFDHVGIGVKHFDGTSLLTRRPNTSKITKEDIQRRLKEDILWLHKNEELLRYLMRVELSYDVKKDTGKDFVTKKYEELIYLMKAVFENNTPALKDFHPSLMHVARMWTQWFYRRNDFHTKMNPVAARSSYFNPTASTATTSSTTATTTPTNKHQCAAFTIVRDDSQMLEIWLRYMNRHFGSDVYVLHHHATEEEYWKQGGPEMMKPLQEKHSFHLTNVFDNNGFPLYFFVTTADLFQRRLLRFGYKCVMLTDADEIIIADPTVYPQGLQDYLEAFVKTKSDTTMRARGFFLAHIYETEDGHNTNDKIIEQPIKWSEPILQQRSYWSHQSQYNKPILSKIPVRVKPGFHNLYIPMKVNVDNDLFLIHLREMDYRFCHAREERKHHLSKQSPQSEIDRLFSSHLIHYEKRKNKGEVCQFAQSIYLKKQQRALDNTGKLALEKIEDKWKTVLI